MSVLTFRIFFSAALMIFSGAVAIADQPTTDSSKTLFSFEEPDELSQITANGVKIKIARTETGSQLWVESGHKIDWPGITLRPKTDFFDATGYQSLSLDITNLGDLPFELGVRIDNPGGDGQKDSVTVMTYLKPGESRVVSASLADTPWGFSKPLKLEGMHAAPGQQAIDPAKIEKLILFLRTPSADHQFTIDNIRFEKPMIIVDVNKVLPFIDEYGQFIHDDWPGKTYCDQQLVGNRQIEQKELQQFPRPDSFNRFGGWKDGPKSAPGKFFRAEKQDGKWWLIDPMGDRFWSHGIDSVSTRFGGTGTEHREDYFRNLPAKDTPLGQFYSDSTWAFGFYANRTPFEMYNFYAANLSRKYGENWRDAFRNVSHQRLRSWGMNTLASWSDADVYLQHKTPYTAFFRAENCPTLEGAEKRWTTFVDVFDPKFREAVVEGIATCQESLGDPWCIGFYVDNELYWGGNDSLAQWTLACPPEQVAKQVFIEDLKSKYESIDKLNETWVTQHKTWDDLASQTAVPDAGKADEDLRAFSKKFAETYFRTINEELDEAAPGQLYLGCRFIWDSEVAVRAASAFCDVVSYNQYRYSVADLKLPAGEDKPILVGEFHFGALDRGLFHATKVPARNQQHRAECYKEFLHSALGNPQVVGTHWFQYTSEPTAGRGDGENYQVGFVDNCDTPYQETIDAARQIGNEMYDYRASAK